MSQSIDEEVLELEELLLKGARPLKEEKTNINLRISKVLYKKLQDAYKGEMSVMFEMDMLRRLRADGLLPVKRGVVGGILHKKSERKAASAEGVQPTVAGKVPEDLIWDKKKKVYRKRKPSDDDE